MVPLNKKWLAALALLSGSYYAFNNYQVEGWQNIRLRPKTAMTSSGNQPLPTNASGAMDPFGALDGSGVQGNGGGDWSTSTLADRLALWVQPSGTKPSLAVRAAGPLRTIKLGSFNMQMYGATKVSKPHVMESLAKICRQFDVLALQEISGKEQDLLPTLVQRINQSGRRFDYMIGPRVGPEGQTLQFAFLFDTERIETDRYQLYSVEDPANLLTYEPLVAWFRTKDLPANEAFTFTMVNVQFDEGRKEEELRILPELWMSIRRDGRQEDDCILAGDFGSNDQSLQCVQSLGMIPALQGLPTNLRGNAMLDNVLFSQAATCEFTGRAGVMDFLREFNLSIDQAQEVSDHLPIWAEFYTNEGGQLGRVAPTEIH